MQWWVEWLFGEGFSVEVITEDAEREYCEGETIATTVWGAESLGKEVGVVFWNGGQW